MYYTKIKKILSQKFPEQFSVEFSLVECGEVEC